MVESIEPISASPIPIAELKLFCRVDGNEDNAELERECIGVVEYLEGLTNSLVVEREIVATYDVNEPIRLKGPYATIMSVTIDDEDVEYTETVRGHHHVLVLDNGQTGTTTVTYTAGFDSMPVMLRQNIKRLVATHYRNREATGEKAMSIMPHSFDAAVNLINRSRRVG